MKNLIKISLLSLASALILSLTSCKKDPSILKVYVKSASSQMVVGARVVIAGDIYSNPATREYVDTAMTNSTGYATFDMDKYFGSKPQKGEVGYFDIIVKSDGKTGTLHDSRVRVRITNVETVKLPN
jgi:hypothetical protein